MLVAQDCALQKQPHTRRPLKPWADFCSVPGSQSSGRRRRAGSLHSSRDHEHRTCLWRKNVSNYYLMCTPHVVGSMACTGLGNKDKAQPVSSSCVCSHLRTLGPPQPLCPHNYTAGSLCVGGTMGLSPWSGAPTCQVREESVRLVFWTTPQPTQLPIKLDIRKKLLQ